MRATIITLSLLSSVALLVLGGFLNALSGFGFDTQSPYNVPARVVGTFIGDAPGLALALLGLGFALWAAARARALRWFIGLLVWSLFPLLAASLMYAGALADAVYWFAPLALLPLAPLLYALVASPAALAATAGATTEAGSLRFGVFAGALALVVVVGAFIVRPQPTTAGTAGGGPPALQVNQPTSTADCANGVYPQVTVTNTGAQTLAWTTTSLDPNVTTSPSGDHLASGASEQVSFSGKTTATNVIVQFTINGVVGNVVKFGCQSGAGK